MRIVTTLAFAALGVLVTVLPCAAQSGAVSVTDQSSSFSKSTASPQRLSPPEMSAPQSTGEGKAPRQDVAPAAAPPEPEPVAEEPPVVPEPVVPRQSLPQEAYGPSNFKAPAASSAPSAPSIAAPSAAPAPGPAAASAPEFASAERLLEWISNYRDRPELWKVPAAVHAMHEHALFTDEEQRWFCIGFIAGVLGTNPNDGPRLVPQMFPLPAKEQEVIIRAIAYSGRPDWRDLLEKHASQMPLRRPLIDDFLNGKRPTLLELPMDVGGAPGVYAHWGYYVATGQHEPVMRIMEALKWSKGKEDGGFSFRKVFSGWGSDPSAVDKITTGGTAKWTLASYAERDRDLIDLYRGEYERQPPEVSKPLKDVIEAAELFESEKIRKDQFGAIEDAQQRQMSAEAGMSKGMTAGSIAIATGCVAATALGQPQIAVPCVIGGALYSGAAKLAR